MKIYPKIIGSFTGVAGVVIAIQLAAIASNSLILQDLERHVAGRDKWIGSATHINLQLHHLKADINELLFEASQAESGEGKGALPGLMAHMEKKHQNICMVLEQWRLNSTRAIEVEEGEEKEDEEEELQDVIALKKANDQFWMLQAQLFQLIDQGNSTAAADLWHIKAQPLYEELRGQATRLFARTDEEGIREGEHLLRSLAKARIINLLAIPISLLLAFIISFLLSRKIVSPVLKFKQAIEGMRTQGKEKRVAIHSKDEIADLAQAFNELIDQLHHSQSQLIQAGKLAAIGALAAGVAHELNQPLMIIRTRNQLLQRRVKKEPLTPEQVAEAMETVDRNTKRMSKIIDHMRTFSRQADLTQDLVQVNTLIEDCFLMIGEQMRLSDVQIKKEFDPDLPRIKGDGNQLEQVFLNLLANGRDAVVERREKGEEHENYQGEIVIHTGMSDDSSQLVILISDNGCGIPPGTEQAIFDPFVTTKEVGRGTGLGLSISYGIIEEHGGQIRVAKSSLEGTTICVELPVDKNVA